jgi:transposase
LASSGDKGDLLGGARIADAPPRRGVSEDEDAVARARRIGPQPLAALTIEGRGRKWYGLAEIEPAPIRHAGGGIFRFQFQFDPVEKTCARPGRHSRRRHLAVDTLGLPIESQVTAANVRDRDALAPLLGAVHRKSPWVTMSFVDGGYQGDAAQRAAFEASRISITVVKRTDKQVTGFIVLPKRWVVERTLGWINRARRLSKDFEATIESSLAWLQLAVAFLLMRRLAREKIRPA